VNVMNEHAAFDAALRAHWHTAQAMLSAQTRTELYRRRMQAVHTEGGAHAGRRGVRWEFAWRPLAAACAAAGIVLALGVALVPGTLVDPSAPAPLVLAAPELADPLTAVEVLDAFDAINLTALDEDADFLDWLASDEASLLIVMQ